MTEADRQLQHWVVTHRVDELDPVFIVLSKLGTLGLVWIGIAVVVALVWRRPDVLVLVTGAVLSADALATALKLMISRPRPYVLTPDPEPLLRTPLDVSLPSGHAATSFAGAATLSWLAPRLAVPLVALAAAVAWSRVYVGVHYPTDIVLGAAFGMAVAATLGLMVRRWPRRGEPGIPRSAGPRALRSPGAARRRSPQARPRD